MNVSQGWFEGECIRVDLELTRWRRRERRLIRISQAMDLRQCLGRRHLTSLTLALHVLMLAARIVIHTIVVKYLRRGALQSDTITSHRLQHDCS
jgi:hypothetical protein